MANLKYFNPITGLWEEIKVSTRLKDLYNTVKLTQDQNYVNIGIASFNPNEDTVFAIWNSTWIQKDEDFILNGGLLRIESKDGSNWNNGDTFNFIVLKNIDKDVLPSADGALLQDGSVTIAKLATSLQNYINKIGVADISAAGATLSDAINELSTSLSDVVQQMSLRPTMTNVNITYYVNATTGNDSNDGLTSGTAFKTIQHVINILPKIISNAINIKIANGAYNEDVIIKGLINNGGSISITGGTNLSDAPNYIINSFSIWDCSVTIVIGQVNITTTTKSAMSFTRCNAIYLSQIYSVASSGYSGLEAINSEVVIGYSNISNKSKAIYSSESNVLSDSMSGTGNATGLFAERGGVIAKAGNQPTGTTNEVYAYGGVIR